MKCRYHVGLWPLASLLLFCFGLANLRAQVSQDKTGAEPAKKDAAEAFRLERELAEKKLLAEQQRQLADAAAALEKERAAILAKFQAAHLALAKQIESLEVDKQKALAELDKKMADLRAKVAQPAKPSGKAASADKLDLILDRLSAIEKRLDTLERKPGLPRQPGKKRN